MKKQTVLPDILSFFLTKIIIGIAVLVGLVFLIESAARPLLDKTNLSDNLKNGIMACMVITGTLAGYSILFKFIEKRKINELSLEGFWPYALTGLIIGFLLQSLFVLIAFFAGQFRIDHLNPLSFMIPSLIDALVAGFVAEIIILGVVFRLTEEKLGTTYTLVIFIILFAILHAGGRNANFISVSATAIQSGFMLSAAYIYLRNLWLPIVLHFAWDFTEPGIYGAINPGNSNIKSLFSSTLNGNALITGGPTGPQNSIQALILCLVAGYIFLWLARRKNNFLPFKLPSIHHTL